MIRRATGILLATLAILAPGSYVLGGEDDDSQATKIFEKKIRPVLARRCYACHSTRAEKVKGGLLLDSREGILRGGVSGAVVHPGHPDKSPLIDAIKRLNVEREMPPRATDRLKPEEIAAFETWIRLGVPVPAEADTSAAPKASFDYEEARTAWPFAPVVDPPVPPDSSTSWARNDVDRFIEARWRGNGIRPVQDADRQTLIRRATFDLIGLPPTPEEVEAFVSDPSADAFERVVERLLASSHYGERWGRHWLDIVRYADTAGDSADYPIPQAHLYRDYVIRSFNEDKPYDRFIREQIAGDLLPARGEEERYENIVATGFLAISRRFGEDPRNDHPLTLDDLIDTMGKAVLGLTLGCARCHDHKFDPIPTQDYYALYGIFNSTRFPYPGSTRQNYPSEFVPLVPVEVAEEQLGPHRAKLADLDAKIRPLEKEIREAEKGLGGIKRAESGSGRSLKELRKEVGDLRKKRESIAKSGPVLPDAYAMAEGTVGDARVHLGGSPEKPGETVARGFLQVLGGQKVASEESGRRELAEWMTDPANPLISRVIVNRIWQHHFGKGIVKTPSYFGKQGLPPTHPELLDYLASRFIEDGWSIKSLHRRIMLSRTYRLASNGNAGNERIDPGNDLLWRFRRRRMDAESIRDAILAVSGTLDRKAGGPHPFPPRSSWKFSKSRPFRAVYPTNRRSVYLMQGRLDKHPYLALFDGADGNVPVAERFVSTTSLQALFMMNDPFVAEKAKAFGRRIRNEADTDALRLDRAHLLAFGRPARSSEVRRAVAYLESRRAAGISEEGAWTSLARVLLSANEFIYVD